MEEKRKRMTLNSEDMPDEVYQILNEKALKRNITAYVIELVQDSLKSKELLKKLDKIENKIDNILSGDIKFDEDRGNNKINNKDSLEENFLKEGKIIEVSSVSGGIEKEDKEEIDF